MNETRVFLSPLLSSDSTASGSLFTNKIGLELLDCRKTLSVRLVTIYSPSDLPPIRIYIKGLRRHIFGEGLEDDFFTIPHLQGGKVREFNHPRIGHLNIHGLCKWEVHITSLTNPRKIPIIPSTIFIQIAISHCASGMIGEQYLPFVLDGGNPIIKLQTFQKIPPGSKAGLMDISIPPLANIFPPFNYIKATTSKPHHSIDTNSLENTELIHTLDIDFYTPEEMWSQAYKFLTEVGCEVRQEGGRLVCHNRANEKITLHRRLAKYWDVKGGEILEGDGESISFKAEGMSFGYFDRVAPIPSPLIFECDMLEDTVVGDKAFRLLRMIYPETSVCQESGIHNQLFENVQMVPTFSRMVFNISFKFLDYKNKKVHFAKGVQTLGGTLLIKCP